MIGYPPGLHRAFWCDVVPISVQFRRCAPKSLDVLVVVLGLWLLGFAQVIWFDGTPIWCAQGHRTSVQRYAPLGIKVIW